MANTVFKLRRSSVAGKKPTTSDIAIGEQALNLTDRILYSSDGTNVWEIGANNTTVNVTNSITVATNSITNSSGIFTSTVNAASHKVGTAAFVANTTGVYTNNNINLTTNGKQLTFAPKAGGSNVSFTQQTDDNFVFYSTDTTNSPRAVFNVFANTESNVQAGAFRLNVPLDMQNNPLYANNSAGTTGQVLASNGSSTYWTTATGTGTVTSVATGAGLSGGTITTSGTLSVNAGYDFTWTNNHTFSANISVTGSGIAVASNTGSVYFGGISDANWRISRNAGITTKFFYTNNSLDIIAASSPKEGIVFGWTGNSYLEVGYAGTYTTLPIYVGNSSVNTTINATSFTGTSNNALYLGGTAAASYVQNTDSRTLSGNLTFTGANLVVSGTNTYITSNTVFGGGNSAAFYSVNGQANASANLFTSNAYATFGGYGGNFLAFGQQTNFAQWIQSGYPDATTPVYYNIILNPLGGNVGIGNTAPTHKLSINGTTNLDGNVTIGSSGLSANGSYGTAGQSLLSNGSATYWATAGATLNANNTDTQTFYIGLSNASTGAWTNAVVSTTKLSFVPDTGVLTATAFSGNGASVTSVDAATVGGNTASTLRTYTDDKAGNAYSNSVSYTDTVISNVNSAITANASAAYSNATSYASNASNISSGTLAEARLPYRMNQDVRTSDNVEFAQMTLTGNLVVSGNVNIIGANNLSISDNMIYLNANNDVTNPDLGIAGNYNDGTYAHTGIFRDATDGIWKVFDSYIPEPDANVYIDTTNTSFHLADFQANSYYAGNTSTNWFVANTLGITHSSNTATFGTAMYVVANGNVGIGNTAPASKLVVNGTIESQAQSPAIVFTGDIDGAKWLQKLGGYNLSFMSDGATNGFDSTTYQGRTYYNQFYLNKNGNAIIYGNVGIGNTAPADKLVVAGNIMPGADNSYNLGSQSLRWANVFTGDLHLSNERTRGNDIDGTTGNWTIQEGESELFIINNKNGKKFKFKLEEVE